jgi:hypothetical protein
MRFIFGAMPQDPEFDLEAEGWVAVREPGLIKIQLIAIPVVVLIALLFQLAFWLAGVDVSPLSNIKNAPIALAIILGVVPIHELLHLVCFPGFGLSENSIIGFWPKMFIPYVHYDGILSKKRFVLIASCPFVVLSITPLLSSFIKPDIAVVIVAVSYLNCLACGVDLISIFLVVKQVPSDAVVRNNGLHSYWRKQYRKNPA